MIGKDEIVQDGKYRLPKGVALIFTLLAGLWVAVFPFLIGTMGFRGDFLAFYTAGHVVWWGDLAQLYERNLFRAAQVEWVGPFEGAYRFVYLPAFIGYYLPFTAFSVEISRIFAVLTGVGLVGIAARISRNWLPLSIGAIFLSVLAFSGSYATFVVGQNSPLTLLLMTLITLWMSTHPRPLFAGGAAAFLLYKPQLLIGLGVVWLAQRAWQSLILLGVGGMVWVALSWWFAPTATLQYLTLGQSLLGSLGEVEANNSLLAALSAFLPSAFATLVAVGATLAILGILAWVWSKYPVQRLHYVMLWLSSLLCTPYVATYDLLLLLLPLSLMVPLLPSNRPLQLAFALVWIAPAISLIASGSHAITWAMLGCYAVCAWNLINNAKSNNTLSAKVSPL